MSTPILTRAECIERQRYHSSVARQLGSSRYVEESESLIHHLTPRAPFADVRVKVGDKVRVCLAGAPNKKATLHGPWRVTEVCPWRGIRCALGWHRSWIIVKRVAP